MNNDTARAHPDDTSDDELVALRARVADLEARLEDLIGRLAEPSPGAGQVIAETSRDQRPWSRRALLLGGAGAAASAAAAVAGAAPAAATAGTMRFGAVNDAGLDTTSLASANTDQTLRLTNSKGGDGLKAQVTAGTAVVGETAGLAVDAAVAGVATATSIGVRGTAAGNHGVRGSTSSVGATHAGVLGESLSNAGGVGVRGTSRGSHGVHGTTVNPTSFDDAGVRGDATGGSEGTGVIGTGPTQGVFATGGFRGVLGFTTLTAVDNVGDPPAGVEGRGTGSYGVVARSQSGAAALLSNGRASGPPTRGAFFVGSLFAPRDGSLWWCVRGGDPGEWRMVVAPVDQAGTGPYVPIDPIRVYDSRFPMTPDESGSLPANGSRVFGIRNSRIAATGAIIAAEVVPLGAKALTVNLGVTRTGGGGHMVLAPGDTAVKPNSSSINWTAAGVTIANGLTVKVTFGQLKVFISATTADFFVDVSGYFLGG